MNEPSTAPHAGQHPGPVEDFSKCHEGIISRLGAMSGLPALLEAALAARSLASDTLNLFEDGVFAHHLDEERALFPSVLLSASPGEEAVQVKALIERLVHEHRELEARWMALQPHVKAAAKGKPASLDAGAVQHLVSTYLAHARFEEAYFLPLAACILGRNANHLAALDVSLHIRHAPPARAGYL
jgi:Hemerythrin HHE cation binding domain